MQRFAIAVTAVAALSVTPALAADMAVKAPPPAPAPVMTWTGFYIGGNAGGGWADTDWRDNRAVPCAGGIGFPIPGCDIPQHMRSFIGGGQAGVRWQTGQWVLGLEGMADYANFNSTIQDPADPAAFDTTRLQNLYTVTAQVGVAWDRALWYVKGGWAAHGLPAIR